ncbi:ATP-dependent DNA helicase chl1 [Coemansia sp. S2]|nr:ATP-dependent DNA helicase chl1 [Coemansia sp. S3946]KAJ2050143.1 ATP-dependent DNA helicase chl1 [Coemansia sp. S2]KAJ2342765.1 ATP-dependent DNA helicase chl1 [Coemansia sp. RSA 2673]
MLDFKDATGSAIMDIEELAKEGWRRCTCPYYGDRASINGAQVVALSYNTLLLRSARQALGISLTGNVVIIDEVHNLVDTILAIHSISLGWRTMRATGNGADVLYQVLAPTKGQQRHIHTTDHRSTQGAKQVYAEYYDG